MHVRRQTHTGSSGKLLGSQHKHAKGLLARWGGQGEQIFWRRAVTKEGGREGGHLKGRCARQKRPHAGPQHTCGQPRRRASFLFFLYLIVKLGSSPYPSLTSPCPGSCLVFSEAELGPALQPPREAAGCLGAGWGPPCLCPGAGILDSPSPSGWNSTPHNLPEPGWACSSCL